MWASVSTSNKGILVSPRITNEIRAAETAIRFYQDFVSFSLEIPVMVSISAFFISRNTRKTVPIGNTCINFCYPSERCPTRTQPIFRRHQLTIGHLFRLPEKFPGRILHLEAGQSVGCQSQTSALANSPQVGCNCLFRAATVGYPVPSTGRTGIDSGRLFCPAALQWLSLCLVNFRALVVHRN